MQCHKGQAMCAKKLIRLLFNLFHLPLILSATLFRCLKITLIFLVPTTISTSKECCPAIRRSGNADRGIPWPACKSYSPRGKIPKTNRISHTFVPICARASDQLRTRYPKSEHIRQRNFCGNHTRSRKRPGSIRAFPRV